MMVAVIGLSTAAICRIQLRERSSSNDWMEAGVLAFSAVEYALVVVVTETVDGDPTWRTKYASGEMAHKLTLGGGSLRCLFVDEDDGNLADDNSDPVRIYGIGQVGQAVRAYSLMLAPTGAGLTCLQVALHAGNDLAFDAATVKCDQTISANNSVSASGSTISANVEAVNQIDGSDFDGSQTTGITPREMPDPETVFDYYIAQGTAIAYAALPTASDGRSIKHVVLSPASNPFGDNRTNVQGIYVIDCQGNDIIVRDCRIVGTLVLLNTGSDSRLAGQLNWEPAVANYPALLVDGVFSFRFKADEPLDELFQGINFNPPGTPYKGQEDAATDDVYPTLVKGLVYVSDDVTSSVAPAFDGVVVTGNTFEAIQLLNLTYDPTCLNNPPPGFTNGTAMVPVAGTWRRDVAP